MIRAIKNTFGMAVIGAAVVLAGGLTANAQGGYYPQQQDDGYYDQNQQTREQRRAFRIRQQREAAARARRNGGYNNGGYNNDGGYNNRRSPTGTDLVRFYYAYSPPLAASCLWKAAKPSEVCSKGRGVDAAWPGRVHAAMKEAAAISTPTKSW